MNIYFYLNIEKETEITSFYNLNSNPFKLNDIVSISVDEFVPAELDKYKEDFKKNMILKNDENRKQFHLKKIKLVRENKYVRYNILSKPIITIEYFCEIIE